MLVEGEENEEEEGKKASAYSTRGLLLTSQKKAARDR